MRLRKKSIKGIIGVKDGFKMDPDETSNVGIEGDKIGIASK